MDDPLLSVRDLQISFETEAAELTVVDGVSFDIDHGEIFGLVGESGSGKSVTALSIMRLLASNATVTAERFEFEGRDLLSVSESELRSIRGGEISMIFQDPMSSLNPVISVGEQIAEVVRHHGDVDESSGFWSEIRRKYVTGTSTSSDSWRRAIELLEIVGIPDPNERAKQYPHQLSGGMQQRVMIAQALAGNPSLIIADEPTTALDVSIEAQIIKELLSLREEFDVSVLFISHDLGVISEICDRVSVIYAGELMETASSVELFENPQHPYTIGLLESIPRISDQDEELYAIQGTVPDPVNKEAGCPFKNRCEYAFEMCSQPLRGHSIGDDGHVAYCHLHDDAATREFSPSADRPSATADVNLSENND